MKSLTVILLTLTIGYFATGCKKTDNGHSQRFNDLLGNWKYSEQGIDSNQNGIVDPNEHAPVPNGQDASDEYYDNGTGKHHLSIAGGASWANPFRWTLENNDQTLSIIDNPGSNNENAYTFSIISLSSQELIVSTPNGFGRTTFFIFTKK